MKTLEEMRARLAQVQDELRGIHTEAGDAALTEERQSEWDSLSTELGTLKADIAKAEARQAVVAELGEKRANVDAPNVIKSRSNEEVFDLDEMRKMAYSGDDYLEKVTDNARRAIERAEYGVRNREAAQERAEELLLNVDTENRELAKRMLLTGSSEYERGFTKLLRHGTDIFCSAEERQALVRAAQHLGVGGADTGGGYAVPFQLDPTVMLTSAGVVNPIRELARVETIVGKEWQGVTSAGTTVSRGAEQDVAPAANFTLGQPTLRTNRVQGYTVFSIEIDLSWSALRSEITRMLVDAKGAEENSFISGNGSGTAPGGINGSLPGTTAVGASDVELADISDGFRAIDLYNVEEALDARWEGNASWLAHKSFYNKVRQFATDGTGATGGSLNNLFVDHITDATPRRLLDYPTYRATGMPSVTSALADADGFGSAAALAIFGDFKQFLIVDRIGMSVEMVPTVLDPTTGRPTGQRGVYTYWMNNSKILIPDAFRRLIKGDNA
jgi:HK97 family phage major capsid protein